MQSKPQSLKSADNIDSVVDKDSVGNKMVHNQPELKRFSLVIPAYNEENRIYSLLEKIKSELTDFYEIIIVCDGEDKTAQLARSIDSRFKVLEFGRRLGKGGAIMVGFEEATGDIVGFVDADGSITPSDIRKVFTSLSNDAPVAIGSRWVKGSSISIRQPFLRVVLGRLYHYLTFAVLGLYIKDTQCGIKAFVREKVQEIVQNIKTLNLSFDTAILYSCKKAGLDIKEVPITWKDVPGSKVKILKTSLSMVATLLIIRLANSRYYSKLNNFISDNSNLIDIDR